MKTSKVPTIEALRQLVASLQLAHYEECRRVYTTGEERSRCALPKGHLC